MSFSDIKDEVANILKGVNGVGKVHKFRRHTTTWEEYFKRHVEDGQVNDWEITRTGLNDEISSIQNSAGVDPVFHDTHNVSIIGYLSLVDAKESETAFQDLIDRITERFRKIDNSTLNGRLIIPAFMQTPEIGHRSFGGVLVHFAQMTLTATERLGC